MPLKLDLKTGIRLVINGAVIENIGPNTKLLVHNESSILREKEILSADDSATPASRAYFALQCAYMFPQEKEKYLDLFLPLLNDYTQALPSSAEIGVDIKAALDEGKLYKALKGAQDLVRHEAKIVEDMRHTAEEETGEYLPEAGDDIGNR
ncbi:MAG: flagellum biosynthesis protein FlbT [Rhodospirillaceae bacterium]|nr:flagellum biosynthesis protein FlbT [Rhodospirillaceae bacterium]MBT7487585.1 flagellum biosynthesis protein FlbT [Rhodospirillales bacterium]MBT4699713.1 flagellum biosynthesis protein FlbT [Rhodospirillaceae bacterium]MBT5033226.1 flagellum biosynthesis protein FlbT [Rhodospirillaceae bacterium]MBT6219002.1 flagellum biosynthesis protein FlbT [Rhodospirillaceae bacterium]